MQVITTHINADLDGLAAMIAAQKLYPGAVMVFPGSKKKNLRDFLSQMISHRYEFPGPQTIEPEQITRLILVGTRMPEKIGLLARCLSNHNLEIHLFDHQPAAPESLAGHFELVEKAGSTTAVLVRLLQQKGLAITAREATIMALGIYDKTSSLTHLSTTALDLLSAAWLLEKGAELNIVSRFIGHDLTGQQVDLLHELMDAAGRYTIQNVPVVIITHALPEYVDDLALIVRRLMMMENLDTVFALIAMADRIYLLAESRIAEVNAGIIARDLGGGGHAAEASAAITDMSMGDAEEALVQSLHRHIQAQPVAREMMSHPAITITAGASIEQAKNLLTRYNVTAMPVLCDAALGQNKICGIISRMVVEKAAHHELGHLPVSEYMTTEIKTLPPEAVLSEIRELIIEHHQRLIPIVEGQEIKGIITRTDLLNRLINDPAHLPGSRSNNSELPSPERSRNVSDLIAESLDKNMIFLFRLAGEIAAELGFEAYAVGGIVRDLLLGKKNLDLDIVVEGDSSLFARAMAEKLNGKVMVHQQFNTAMVVMPDGFKIDIAAARLEYYEYPAALPTVEYSSIKLDLYRRDFTINAMAVHLNPEHFGILLDFFNCQNDLEYKSIKVLHNLSFVEDPTRIFRAVRLEQRMGFQISRHTRRLIKNAVNLKLFGQKHNSRFFHELQIIFSEENPIPAIHRLADFDLFPLIWPELGTGGGIDERFTEILTQAHNAVSWLRLLYLEEKCDYWLVYLLAVMARCQSQELEEFCRRFSVAERLKDKLADCKNQAEAADGHFLSQTELADSEKYQVFSGMSTESLLYLMAVTKSREVRQSVSHYITCLKEIKPFLSGRDLIGMGYKAGPRFKEILQTLKYARMDGITKSAEDEVALVKKQFNKDVP